MTQIYSVNSKEILPSKKKILIEANLVNVYKTRLLHHLREEKPYLETKLSLRLLANQINIHPNQLSWLLNENIGQNFNTFINSYRIQTFKEKAKNSKNTHLNIESLAYESGFNSKTVFNTYFKKETGLTPKQF
jgi:adenylate cyclase